MSVVLKVNGTDYSGWKTASVTRGINQLAGNFSLSVSEQWPGSSLPTVGAGDECQILVNNTPVITGYIDDVAISYSATSHEISVKGRSKVADLIDCSILVAKQYTDEKIERIATDLVKDYRITVITEVETGEPITEKINVGESPFEAISKFAEMRGLIITDDPEGNLVFTRTSENRASAALINKPGQTNILTGSATLSMRDRYQIYRCISQTKGDDHNNGEAVAAIKEEVKDQNVIRHRPLVVIAENAGTNDACKKRAEWEMANRIGGAIEVSYTVNGWEQSSGALWVPNLRVSVDDDFLNQSGEFVVSNVTLSVGPGGATTALSCVLPESFTPEPEAPDTGKVSPNSGSASSTGGEEDVR